METQRFYGTGTAFFTPKTDITGAALALQTPVRFADMEDCAIDLSADIKFYRGQQVYAQLAGEGDRKIELKAKTAEFDYRMLAQFLGLTPVANIKDVVPSEPITIAASLTTTPPNSGTFVNDLGVINVVTGEPMTKVASGPTTGQYSVSGAGVYTFATADIGVAALRSYEYSATGTSRASAVIANRPKQLMPTFGLALDLNSGTANAFTLVLNACVASKLSLPFKAGDFAVTDFDMQAIADSTGAVGYINVGA